ncbi:MAG: DUF5818 domain-containing protein [Blastocatellia bacterium]
MRAWILGIGVASLAFATSPAFLMARPGSSRAFSPQAQSQQQPDEIETFTGIITKNADHKFVLEEDTAKAFYILDDQAEASKFSGKRVKVTGRLDAASSIIHVKSIEQSD